MTTPHGKKRRSNFRQQGMALIGMAFFIFVVLLGFLLDQKSRSDIQVERDQITTRALAQAKEALIAYAVNVDLNTVIANPSPPPFNCDNENNCPRPGDLLCPDMDNDGVAESYCGDANGTSQQANRLGRLPWKTLNIPDIRDGYGERLWYAVSNNFKNNARYFPLNSDTPGTITLRNNSGTVVYNASAQNGVAAVVISAGPPLQRQGSASAQDRSCLRGGANDATCVTDSSEVCSSPATDTSKCNPQNYLDISSGVEDNAQFFDGSGSDGFISGPIKDASGNFVVNDRVVAITIDEIMPYIERRVLREVRACLIAYAATSNNRYPWAASSYPSYSDMNNQRFGRIPDTPFNNTASGGSGMSNAWPASGCDIVSDKNWWSTNNWKEFIFYAVASAFEPAGTPATSCGSCLQVSTTTNRKIVVIAAGRKLSGQSRANNSDKSTISNYLELQNSSTGDNIFQQGAVTSTFNDKVMYWPTP